MPYRGGSLVSLFDGKPQAETRLALRRLAERGGDRMVELTVMNTPIDTGNLRTSWYQLPTQRTRYGPWPAYQSGVATDVGYAPHVEYGTGLWGPRHAKYPITAKGGGMLRWEDGSGVHYARRVMHPGSPGQHMVAIAGSVAEHEMDSGTLGQNVLQEWATAVETSAD